MNINAKRYDSRYNSEYKERIQDTIEFILNKKYGESILHTELAGLLHYNIEVEEYKRQYKSTMARIKNFLIDYGYILKSIGSGYYILKPKQISGYCYRTYIERTRRILDKSEKILNRIDERELSEDRKEEKKLVMELNYNLQKNIDKTIISSRFFSRKKYFDDLGD